MKTLAVIAMLAVGGWFFGTPHLRVEYTCTAFRGECASYTRCEYLGLEGWRVQPGGDCPIVRLFPIKWRPVA